MYLGTGPANLALVTVLPNVWQWLYIMDYLALVVS